MKDKKHKPKKFDPCCYIPNQQYSWYNWEFENRKAQELKRQRAKILKNIDNYQKIKNNGNKQQCRKPNIRDSRNLARGEARNKTISTSPRSL